MTCGKQDRVGPAVRDVELGTDRVRQGVVDADERVRERQPGHRRRVRHRGARLEVGAVGVGPRQRVEDQPRGLHAERVGVGRGEDRHGGLEGVGERVDAGVGGDVGGIVSVSVGSTIAMSGSSE